MELMANTSLKFVNKKIGIEYMGHFAITGIEIAQYVIS